LEERGYIDAEWRQSDQGRMAKYYKLTKKGARQLETERADWERVVGAITLILREAKR
jgi:DNA-binding PadR family transcriptional regulator